MGKEKTIPKEKHKLWQEQKERKCQEFSLTSAEQDFQNYCVEEESMSVERKTGTPSEIEDSLEGLHL